MWYVAALLVVVYLVGGVWYMMRTQINNCIRQLKMPKNIEISTWCLIWLAWLPYFYLSYKGWLLSVGPAENSDPFEEKVGF